MKKLLLLLLIATRAFAQLQPQQPSQGLLNGQIYANGYANWSVPMGLNGEYSWTSDSYCTANSGGTSFPAFTVGTPITIIDSINPQLNEVVTVTAVNTFATGCSIATTTPVHQHSSFSLATSTAGLQEAINANLSSPAPTMVHLTTDWYKAGGQLSQVTTSIKGNSNIGIVDDTRAPSTWYQWNGSNYVPVTIGAGGCPGSPGCVQSLNSLQGAVNLQAGSNIILTPSGNNLTIASTGGSGGLTGGPWNVGRYGSQTATAPVAPSTSAFVIDSTTTLSQLNALIASLAVPASNAPATQLGTITIPDGVGALPLTNVPSTSGAGNPGVPVNDIRIGARTATVSTWGVVGNERAFAGTFTSGQNTVTPGAITVLASDVGSTIVVTGTVGGVPTRFMPTVTAVNTTTGIYTISTNAPFSAFLIGKIGYLNTTNFQRAMTGIGAGNLVGQLPAGSIMTGPVSCTAGQSLVGDSAASSIIIGLPGEDVIQNPDASGAGNCTRGGLRWANFTITVDNSIDATKPWNAVDASGNTVARTPLNRPIENHSPNANNPLGPGWAANATNGVATITSGSAVICVPTTYFSRLNATAGNQIIFRDTPTVFQTSVSSLSGAGCSSGFSGATLAATAPANLTQTEWVQTTQVQALTVAVPSGSITYPYTITVGNSTSPVPGFESNVATHGRVKIANYEFDYLGGRNGSAPYTLILRDGPATVTALSIGTAVVPENPCYEAYETPWPVIPTVNSNDSTPSGATYFPGACVGNAAIAMPEANGNVYVGTGFSNGSLENINLFVSSSNGTNPNNVAGFYVGGNNAPYGTTFSNINVTGETYDIVQGPPSTHTHGWGVVGPTGYGNRYLGLNLRGALNIVMDDAQGIHIDTSSGNTTGENPYDGSQIGAETAFGFGFALDDQTGGLIANVSAAKIDAINSEPEGGTHAEAPPYMYSDCANCDFNNDQFEGAWSIFGGGNQKVAASTELSQPVVNYGNHNFFEETDNTGAGPVSSVWGSCKYCEWGTYSRAGVLSAYGSGPTQNYGIGDRAPYSGETSESFSTGNYVAPYGSSLAGYISPDEMASGGMTVGKTLDPTELKAGAYSACNVANGCQIEEFNGFNGYIAIGYFDRLHPIAYDLSMNLKTAGGSYTLTVYLQAGNQYGACGTPGTIVNFNLALTATWTTFTLPVNLANYAGCNLQFSFDGAPGDTYTDVGAVQFTPVPGLNHGRVITYTAGAACPTWAVAGDILGIDASNQYFCGTASTVVAQSLAGGGGGITGLSGDTTGSGTGVIATTTGNINGGTPFKSQVAGPECNSGSTGQLNHCTNLNVTGTVIGGVYNVPSAATSVFDLTQANSQLLTLTQNTTSTLTAGTAGGQDVNFEVCENSTGGYTFSWPTNFNGAPPINTGAGQCTTARGYYDGTNVNVDGWNSPLCQVAVSGGAYQCGAAYKGLAAIPAGTNSTIVVDTTALGASSLVFIQGDESAAVPGVTCGTSTPTGPLVVSARTAGVSFTLEAPGTISGSYCFTYFIVPTP